LAGLDRFADQADMRGIHRRVFLADWEQHAGVMSKKKSDLVPRGDRPPAYVDRETGAAELRISPETWDKWVAEGRLPAAAPGFPETTPRWRWEDVDRKLAGRAEKAPVDFHKLAANLTNSMGRRRGAGVTLPEGVEKARAKRPVSSGTADTVRRAKKAGGLVRVVS
jgi:hypothetical protein